MGHTFASKAARLGPKGDKAPASARLSLFCQCVIRYRLFAHDGDDSQNLFAFEASPRVFGRDIDHALAPLHL